MITLLFINIIKQLNKKVSDKTASKLSKFSVFEFYFGLMSFLLGGSGTLLSISHYTSFFFMFVIYIVLFVYGAFTIVFAYKILSTNNINLWKITYKFKNEYLTVKNKKFKTIDGFKIDFSYLSDKDSYIYLISKNGIVKETNTLNKILLKNENKEKFISIKDLIKTIQKEKDFSYNEFSIIELLYKGSSPYIKESKIVKEPSISIIVTDSFFDKINKNLDIKY